MPDTSDQRIVLLLERIERLCDLIEKNAPDVILTAASVCVVKSLTLLWPGLWAQLVEDMHKTLRNQAGVCSQCGETEIPALLTHHVECRRCHASFVKECREKYDSDPYEPNPPDVEEIMVDLTNLEAAKVNNLPTDFTDALERMLEARTQEPNDA